MSPVEYHLTVGFRDSRSIVLDIEPVPIWDRPNRDRYLGPAVLDRIPKQVLEYLGDPGRIPNNGRLGRDM